MLLQRVCLLLCVPLLSTSLLLSCKEGGDSGASTAAEGAEESEKINEAEDELLAKRDELFNMRRNLQNEREDLKVRRAQVVQGGGDIAGLQKSEQALEAKEKDFENKTSALDRMFRELASNRRTMVAMSTNNGSEISSREAGVASRERQLARRESSVALREAALSKREEGLASKWKEGCGAGISTQTIIRTVDSSGTTYTKSDVEPLLSKARREMGKRGVLRSDLPQQAKGLEREANKGIKDGDYGRARLAASQLLATVRGIKVDRSFIGGKFARLNQRMTGKRLSSKAEKLMRDATSLYGDGKFSKANGKLNKLYASLR